jgi:hypothetical protein
MDKIMCQLIADRDQPGRTNSRSTLHVYAHRPLARRLLAQASERETPMDRMRIISVEGLIGFKLQGFVNDPTRTRDLDELREYFALFNKPELLHELLA